MTATRVTQLQLADATGPQFLSGTGSPNGSLAATQGSLFVRTDVPQIWQNTTGAMVWTQLGTSGSGTMAATINKLARPANVNLVAEGTADWLYVTTATPILNTVGTLHAPSKYGGWLTESFQWRPGLSGTPTVDAGPTTYTSTLPEDLCLTALNTTGDATYHNSSGNTTANQGFRFRVPAGPGSRRIRLYSGSRDNTLTITALASNGSMAPVVATNVAVGTGRHMYEIVFTGPLGSELIVSGATTAGTAAFPIIQCGAITVADI